MNSGLYDLEGVVATACAAAWANWLQDPTTNDSKVNFGFKLMEGENTISAFSSVAVLIAAALSEEPWISYRICFTVRFSLWVADQICGAYSCSIQSRVAESGTLTQSLGPSALRKKVFDSQFWYASRLMFSEINFLICSQLFILLSQSAHFLHNFSTACGKPIIQTFDSEGTD